MSEPLPNLSAFKRCLVEAADEHDLLARLHLADSEVAFSVEDVLDELGKTCSFERRVVLQRAIRLTTSIVEAVAGDSIQSYEQGGLLVELDVSAGAPKVLENVPELQRVQDLIAATFGLEKNTVFMARAPVDIRDFESLCASDQRQYALQLVAFGDSPLIPSAELSEEAQQRWLYWPVVIQHDIQKGMLTATHPLNTNIWQVAARTLEMRAQEAWQARRPLRGMLVRPLVPWARAPEATDRARVFRLLTKLRQSHPACRIRVECSAAFVWVVVENSRSGEDSITELTVRPGVAQGLLDSKKQVEATFACEVSASSRYPAQAADVHPLARAALAKVFGLD